MTSKTAPAGISAIVTEGSGEIYLDVLQDGRAIRVGPVDRRSLLAALGAEPDESDYTEVVEENNRLSRKLSAALRERDANRAELDEAREALRAAEEPRDDQDQIDRSWALEKAGEVLGRLAAVGALPKDWAGLPVLSIAEWILGGEAEDRG